MPSRLPPSIHRRLEPIRLLVLDVDGVLTDGTLVYSADGEVIKSFNVRDGLGIRMLKECDVEVGVITGRSSPAVAVRCSELGMDDQLVVLGSRDKAADLDAMLSALDLRNDEIAVMGDDLPDLPILARAGFAVCPSDAAPEVAAACDLVCGTAGGRGAVREFAELLLKAKGRWIGRVELWTSPDRGSA